MLLYHLAWLSKLLHQNLIYPGDSIPVPNVLRSNAALLLIRSGASKEIRYIWRESQFTVHIGAISSCITAIPGDPASGKIQILTLLYIYCGTERMLEARFAA